MRRFLAITIMVLSFSKSQGQQDSFLFRTPLSFYNTDILSYLQVLHKNQQYEKMVPFFTGPLVAKMSKSMLIGMLADAPFGYSMKREGIREVEPKQQWSLTYSRTLLGTQQTFTIDCVLERDTCRLVLTEQAQQLIFTRN